MRWRAAAARPMAVIVAALGLMVVAGLAGWGPLAGLLQGPPGSQPASPPPTSRPAPPASPLPPGVPETPEAAASRFVVAYLSWRWDEPIVTMQGQVRPYVTDRLWERLTSEPSSQWTNPGGLDAHEVDAVGVQEAMLTAATADGATVVLSVVVAIRTDQGSSQEPRWVRVQLVRGGQGWLVDDVEL